MADKLLSPLAVTFVRASQPSEDKYYAVAQDRMRVQANEAETFARWRVRVPDRLDLVGLFLEVFCEEAPFAGDLVVREVSLSGPTYRKMTWKTRPANRAGSVDRTATEDGRRLWVDVTTDYGTTLLEDGSVSPWLAYRLRATNATKQWLVGPSAGRFAPRLRMVTQPKSFDPFDLSPAGNVSVPKPVFQWTVPLEVTHVQLQVDVLAGDFTAPLYDTGQIAPGGGRNITVVNTELYDAWAGIPVDGASARARHWTSSGPSGWQEVEVALLPKETVALTNPGATDADPTPPLVWDEPAEAFQVLVWDGAELLEDSDVQPGPATTWTPTRGARQPGDEIRREVRWFDGEDRATSIGDPPWVLLEQTTTFEPSAGVLPLDTVTATQDGETPAVLLGYTRAAGVPDHVALEFNGELIHRIPGPELPIRDWTFPPNTDLVVGGRAVVNGAHSAVVRQTQLRTVVEKVWLVDPETERGFTVSGTDGLEVTVADVVVVNEPISSATLIRRTVVLRDESGSIRGRIGDWPGRTVQQQKADAEWLRERPQRPLQLVMYDLNIPVVTSIAKPLADRDLFFTDRPVWNVSFGFSHAGAAAP